MDAQTRSSFGSLLKSYRLARGLSQEALAERSGLSREAISLLERGLRLSPQRDTVGLLVKTLQLSSDERTELLAAMPARRRRAVAATRAEASPPPSLPLRLTSFIGREQEIAGVRELVLSRRLLTLSGPGGIGKTSLAHEAARALTGDFPDGVVLVELAALADGALVPQAIAGALGVREQANEDLLTTLGIVLGPTYRLLVIDNCEHLVDACARVAETLLQTCPRLHLLVTSREPLQIGAEVIWRVPPLSLPKGDESGPPQLAASEAVRLFVDRAQALRPSLPLGESNHTAIAEICRRLDGIPLAIELAAARTTLLAPAQIVEHLGDRFRLLAAGSRTALPRHQTLRAAVDWSHALLSAREQTLFRRLAVFAGGWSLEAATAICGGPGSEGPTFPTDAPWPTSPSMDVLDLLFELQTKSMVLVEERDGAARFRLLETLREYGWERLAEAGEADAARERHRNWLLTLAERAGPELCGPRQDDWLDLLEEEHDNLRAALSWTLERGPAQLGLRLAGALWPLWQRRDHRQEGREWLTRVLAAPGAEVPTRARAEALDGACELCGLALYQGDRALAERLAQESLAICRALDDRRGIARALARLAMVANQEGSLARTEELGALALAHAQDAGDRWIAARTWDTLGLAALQRRDRALARERLEASLAIFRELGDALSAAGELHNLGWVAAIEGDNRAARASFEEALELARALDSQDWIGQVLRFLGLIAQLKGDYPRAWELLAESDELARQTGDRGLFALGRYTEGLLARGR
jgi:non-specific serine/threonine protein kinase